MKKYRLARFKATIEFVKLRRELRAFEDAFAEILATRGARRALQFLSAMVADGYLPRLDGVQMQEWVLELCLTNAITLTEDDLHLLAV